MPNNRYKDVTITQMMIRIGRMSWKNVHSKIPDAKLSNVQYKVCVVIHNSPGLSQDTIARELGMDKSSIAKCVARLIDNGYVIRALNPDDHREYQLKLSDKGEEEVLEFIRYTNEWEKDLCGRLGRDVYDSLKKNLSLLATICDEN